MRILTHLPKEGKVGINKIKILSGDQVRNTLASPLRLPQVHTPGHQTEFLFCLCQLYLLLANASKFSFLENYLHFFKMQNCYVCHMNLPAHELDDHLISHVLGENALSGQFVSDTLLLNKLPFHYDARLLRPPYEPACS